VRESPLSARHRFGRTSLASTREEQSSERVNVWLRFILYLIGVVFLPVEVIYAQSQLNCAWRAEPDRITRLSAIEVVAGPGLAASVR
jgi:hypothetical protein